MYSFEDNKCINFNEELLDFDDIPGLREMPAQTSDYFDDEDDIDFEMDFIDLDD